MPPTAVRLATSGRQDEINRRLVELAQAGRTVVRLKGGDPGLFGHLVEEVGALRAAGIPYEIVPGITAASAVASHAGIPLTGRDAASAVAFVTGHECDDKEQPLDFGRAGPVSRHAGLLHGRDHRPPLVDGTAGRRQGGRHAGGRRLRGRACPTSACCARDLADVADAVERTRLRPPAIFVVGPTAAAVGDLDWFSRRPLSGVTVLVDAGRRDPTIRWPRSLEELGAKVVASPGDRNRSAGRLGAAGPRDRALVAVTHWLVFSSANGVEAFFDRLLATGHDLRALGRSSRLAAIGPGTAEALARYHLQADLVPPEFRAESLAEALAPLAAGRRCLLVRASRGREVLAERLRAAGAEVEQVVAYSSVDVPAADDEVAKPAGRRRDRLDRGHQFSAIARSLVRLFGPDLAACQIGQHQPGHFRRRSPNWAIGRRSKPSPTPLPA